MFLYISFLKLCSDWYEFSFFSKACFTSAIRYNSIVVVRSLDKFSIIFNEPIAFIFLYSQFSIVCILKTVENLSILMP